MESRARRAARFADAGPVQVEITVRPDTVELAVSDSGPGLDVEQRARPLAPFVQIEAGGRLGIGLAIASRIAELGDGELRLDNAVQGGVRASVELPVVADPGGGY